MEHKNGCIICGEDLKYSETFIKKECHICKKSSDTNVTCINDHFICDTCHSMSADDYIENYCINSKSIDPINMVFEIMKNDKIKMHGPEHHFLVPAVLLTAYYNYLNNKELKIAKLSIAKKRALSVPGGFCGFYGNCGAGVGTGIFISLITDATPLSKNEWRLSNLMTSKSLLSIANNGGPRCCKRDTFLAINEALLFLKNNFNIELSLHKNIKCDFYSKNRECQTTDCLFY